MSLIWRSLRTAWLMGKELAPDVVPVFLGPSVTRAIRARIGEPPTQWASVNYIHRKTTVDGCTSEGLVPGGAYAKFAMRKGLPTESTRRTGAVENEPHTVDGFDGEIAAGYGAGRKSLLLDDRVPVKHGERRWIGRANYHRHDARRAGTHYDLVVEGLPEHPGQFEINIPRGENAGRYAFIPAKNGYIVTRMKDRSVLHGKPGYVLKPKEFLTSLNPDEYSIERKLDGSLGNGRIEKYRVHIRSHREEGKPYYDLVPELDDVANHSRFLLSRKLIPGPDQEGTEFQFEFTHPDGVSRMSGILNSQPGRAQATQRQRGAAQGFVWDLVKLRGQDVSQGPYGERRALYEQVVKEIRLFNPNWHVAEQCPKGMAPLDYYNLVINDPRGLPWSEGVVVKKLSDPRGVTWVKVKNRDYEDFEVTGIFPSAPGTKFHDAVSYMTVKDPVSGYEAKIGSFAITDEERRWILAHKDECIGSVGRFTVMEKTDRGAPRSGTFIEWHPDPRYGGVGAERGLQMYAESLAGMDPEESKRMLYRLKSSAGWRK